MLIEVYKIYIKIHIAIKQQFLAKVYNEFLAELKVKPEHDRCLISALEHLLAARRILHNIGEMQ